MYDLNLALSKLIDTPSDINEHLDILKILSSSCSSIIELGVRSAVSTHALLAGKPKEIKSFDINPIGSIENNLSEYAINNNIFWKFYNENCLTTNNIDCCDMIFIDTFHSFKQMSCELFLHGNKAQKYLVFHDTVTFGHRDELGELQLNNLPESLKIFISLLPNKNGIMPAIEYFVSDFPHWIVKEHFKNNNGLLILERK